MIADKSITTIPFLPPKFYPILRKELRKWWRKHRRRFPWRESDNPYHIFVAEFMLQKTQVAKVEQIYMGFIENYPNVKALALASPQKIKAIFGWLGLLKRADFIMRSAKMIVDEFGESIPQNSDDLLRLPGIGTYTANAILCFGYGQPYPIVDSTIARVLKRLLGYETWKSAWEDRITWDIASEFLDQKKPMEHNYALIDLAALVCLQKTPICEKCPVQKLCVYANNH